MNAPLHQRTIPESYAQLLFEYLEQQGLDAERVLQTPWPEVNTNDGSGVQVETWEQLLQTAETALNDPLLGLKLGQTVHARHFGVVGASIQACKTLREAITYFERYLRLVFDVMPVTLAQDKNQLDIVWDSREFETGRLTSETGTVAMVHFIRLISRGPAIPLRVTFFHASPKIIVPYEAYFGCPVLFEQPTASIRLSLAQLDTPLKSPDPELIALLDIHAQRLLAQLPTQNETLNQVRRAITELVRSGEPSIHQISQKLGCSPRTLQRKLQANNTSFRDELNQVRYQLAQTYLKDPSLQIIDIAMLLGYSEHSAFTRAFKEWSGMTPQEAKRQSELK